MSVCLFTWLSPECVWGGGGEAGFPPGPCGGSSRALAADTGRAGSPAGFLKESARLAVKLHSFPPRWVWTGLDESQILNPPRPPSLLQIPFRLLERAEEKQMEAAWVEAS